MTEKDLKKLNRYQLLELLISQTERADKLQERVDSLEQELKDRDVRISSLGSIAEASLDLGGVFSSAQAAADMYIEAAKKQAAEIEKDAEKKALAILTRARNLSRRIKGK